MRSPQCRRTLKRELWFRMAETKKSCGFAMVETGFTRAKNAGNIIMKNLMDFCIGTMMVFLLGCDLMMGQHGSLGLIGKPERGMFLDFEGFDRSSFVFQLVFCATAPASVSQG